MGIKIREVSENSGGTSVKFTGLALLKVLIVNPNRAQLEKMGIKVDEEPKYITTETDENTNKPFNKVRLTFYFLKEFGEGEAKQNIILSNSIFLEQRANFSGKKDKLEVIDKFGKGFYMDVTDFKNKNFAAAEYLDKTSIAACYPGQSQLISLMRTLVGSQKDDETTLADLSVGGNPASLWQPGGHNELNTIISNVNSTVGNKVKALLYVRSTEEGKHFQDIFPYNIGRAYSGAEYFHKELVRMYKNNSRYFENRDFGPIDLSNDKVNAEQYRLRIWEGDAPQQQAPATAGAPSAPATDNGYPADWDDPAFSKEAPAAAPATGGSDVFDPFG